MVIQCCLAKKLDIKKLSPIQAGQSGLKCEPIQGSHCYALCTMGFTHGYSNLTTSWLLLRL
ncbi:MAG: hypothetical protein ABFS35_15455, partial [Bacteroidota bacterium]